MSLSQLSRADARNLVEFAKLDLGTTGGGCLSACDSGKPRKYYPSLYLDGKEDLPLPMKGKATIEYRITSKTRSQDDAGKISESARLEVLSIEPAAEPVKPAKAKLLSRADARNLVEFARAR